MKQFAVLLSLFALVLFAGMVTERFNGDHDIKFTVAVSENKDRAATEVVIRRNGRVIHRQKSDFVLQASAVRYRPR